MGALYGTLVSLCIGASDIPGRKLTQAGRAVSATFLIQAFALLVALAALLVVRSTFSGGALVLGMFSGVGFGTGLAAYYQGVDRASATVVAPVVAAFSAIIPFVWTVARGADVGGIAWLGAAVAVAGLVLVTSGTASAEEIRLGAGWGLLGGLGYGVGIGLLIDATEASGVWPAIGQRITAMLLMLTVALVRGMPVVPKAKIVPAAMFTGVLSTSATVFYLLGVQTDGPSTVVTGTMFPIVSVGIGWLFFHDKVTSRQVLGIGVVLAGVLAVVLS